MPKENTMVARLVIALSMLLSLCHATIGHCEQADFYSDRLKPLVRPITSEAILSQYLHRDTVDPLPAGLKLDRVIVSPNFEEGVSDILSNNSPTQKVFSLKYDGPGRVSFIRIYDPNVKKMVLHKRYLYETNAPDSFVKWAINYNVSTFGSPPQSEDIREEYVYRVVNGTKKLSKVDCNNLIGDKIISRSTVYQPDYDTSKFPMGIHAAEDIEVERDKQNRITKNIKNELWWQEYDPDNDKWYEYSNIYTSTYRRNPAGLILRIATTLVNTWDTSVSFPLNNFTFVRDATGLLYRIKDKDGNITVRYQYFQEVEPEHH